MSSLRRIKKFKKKEKSKLAKEALKDSAKEVQLMAIYSLAKLCGYYKAYFHLNIDFDKMKKVEGKVEKMTEKNTLWFDFRLEEIILRAYRSLKRILDEILGSDKEKLFIKIFDDDEIVKRFEEKHIMESAKLGIKYGGFINRAYPETERETLNFLDLYGIFNIFQENAEKIGFPNLTSRYVKTFITKTKNKFNEMLEVLTEGGEVNHEEDMLSLLDLEEAGFGIKWVGKGYSREKALKIRKSRCQETSTENG